MDIKTELQFLILQKLRKHGIIEFKSASARKIMIKVAREAMKELKCDTEEWEEWQEFLNSMLKDGDSDA